MIVWLEVRRSKRLGEVVTSVKNASQVRQRMHQLAEEIREHQYRYYVEDRPTVSDAQFDDLWRELLTLEESHPDLVDARGRRRLLDSLHPGRSHRTNDESRQCL